MINRVKICEGCTLTEHCFRFKGWYHGITEGMAYLPRSVKDCETHDEVERALKEKK